MYKIYLTVCGPTDDSPLRFYVNQSCSVNCVEVSADVADKLSAYMPRLSAIADKQCPTCDGHGCIADRSDCYLCPRCDGTGTTCGIDNYVTESEVKFLSQFFIRRKQ